MQYKGSHRKPKGRHRGSVKQRIKRIVVSTMVAGIMLTIPSSLPIPATADSAVGRQQAQELALVARNENALVAASRTSSNRDPVGSILVAPEQPKVLKESVGVSGVKAVPEPEPVQTETPSPVSAPAFVGVASNGRCGNIGVVANAQAMCNDVYALFGPPTIGGLRPGDPGDHGTGHAIDIMVYGNTSLGNAIADYALSHVGTYNIKYVIWQQRYWSPQRGYWSLMEDRGSITANHYDHVHVSFN